MAADLGVLWREGQLRLDPDAERLFVNSRAKTNRLRVVRRALKLGTHPAKHRDQVSVGMDWSRIDLAQMIAMVAAFR
jgi:hypothetical protein